jgi:hypothetical protein
VHSYALQCSYHMQLSIGQDRERDCSYDYSTKVYTIAAHIYSSVSQVGSTSSFNLASMYGEFTHLCIATSQLAVHCLLCLSFDNTHLLPAFALMSLLS